MVLQHRKYVTENILEHLCCLFNYTDIRNYIYNTFFLILYRSFQSRSYTAKSFSAACRHIQCIHIRIRFNALINLFLYNTSRFLKFGFYFKRIKFFAYFFVCFLKISVYTSVCVGSYKPLRIYKIRVRKA